MRVARAVGLVVGFILAPAFATAGPIPFLVGLSSQALPDGNGGAGHFSIVEPADRPTAVNPGDSPLTLTKLRLTPRAPADPGWQQGTARPVVGVTPFSLGLTFTDVESGAVGSLEVTGSARSEWLHEAEGPFTLTGAWINFDPVTDGLVLGVNRYEIFTTGASGTEGDLAGFVTFLANPSAGPPEPQPPPPTPPQGGTATPEPGTLALAGLGLATAAGYGVRRRRAG
jgi:hypothetical protein